MTAHSTRHGAAGDGPDPYATRMPTASPLAREPPDRPEADPLALSVGDRFDDFEVVSVLGRGSFGTVYLAREVSLDRRVALKVSPCRGQEGQALARLDHPHIVTVHGQQARDGLRILCMQYVPSLPLDKLLGELAPQAAAWSGADLLAAVDRTGAAAVEFDPGQLEDRQMLAALDHVAAVCFIGSRLAAALGHAHRQGVLHRDIKPANVIVSRYGRPLLIDFNMAAADTAPDEAMFGGTLAYMAPEHLTAFDANDAKAPSAVDAASDQYSLGVLIYELAVGRLPFPTPADHTLPLAERLRALAAVRIDPGPDWAGPLWQAEPGLAAVLRRALTPDPSARWPSCDAFAEALADTIGLRRALVAVRREDFLPSWCGRHPFAALALAGVLPNAVGSAVNIPYNLLRVVPHEQEPTFLQVVNLYNLFVYPVCLAMLVAVVWPVFEGWRGRSSEPAKRLRARSLFLPRWAIRISLVGWLPGAFFFPWALHARAVTLPWTHLAHFHISILIAGLIAVTYSALAVLCIVAFIIYPAFWIDPARFRRRAAREVAPVLRAMRFIPFLAGAIPLVAVMLLITASPHTFSDDEYVAFRLLTLVLIALGMAGFEFARLAMTRARGALEAFAGVAGTDAATSSARASVRSNPLPQA